MKYRIYEQNPDAENKALFLDIDYKDGKVWIQPDGYGDKTSQDGHGYPIGIEMWEGELRVVLFKDINEEDATIISMEQAKETNRED